MVNFAMHLVRGGNAPASVRQGALGERNATVQRVQSLRVSSGKTYPKLCVECVTSHVTKISSDDVKVLTG